jgi:hypothetical protein
MHLLGKQYVGVTSEISARGSQDLSSNGWDFAFWIKIITSVILSSKGE